MFFVKKIFLNNKPLILTNSAEQYFLEDPCSSNYLFLKGAFLRNFNIALSHIEKRWNPGAVIEDESVEQLKKILRQRIPIVEACGGIVENEYGELLMIFRRGKWDLPKGKLDEGESLEECAIREIREETGLQSLELLKKLTETYHIFLQGNKRYLKETHWFEMKADKRHKLQPQLEENILEAKWVPEDEIDFHLRTSYEGIKELVRQYVQNR